MPLSLFGAKGIRMTELVKRKSWFMEISLPLFDRIWMLFYQ